MASLYSNNTTGGICTIKYDSTNTNETIRIPIPPPPPRRMTAAEFLTKVSKSVADWCQLFDKDIPSWWEKIFPPRAKCLDTDNFNFKLLSKFYKWVLKVQYNWRSEIGTIHDAFDQNMFNYWLLKKNIIIDENDRKIILDAAESIGQISAQNTFPQIWVVSQN